MAKPTKTDRVLRLLLELSRSKGNRISKEKAMEVLDVKKAGFHKTISPLLEPNEVRPALLHQIDHEGGIFYKLNQSDWNSFSNAGLEGRFFLESYKHIGHLLNQDYDNFDIDPDGPSKRDIDDLKKKFLYLSKVQAKPFSKQQKEILENIIKGLTGNSYMYMVYGEKHQPRRMMPLTLCQYRDDLYFIAKEEIVEDGENEWQIKTFKVCRIKSISLNTDTFKYPTSWKPEEVYKTTSGLIIGPEQTAVINVYGVVRRTFKEREFFGSKLIDSTDEYDQYELIYTNESEFLGQIFTYADSIEVLCPQDLRKQFFQKALNSQIKDKNIA